MDLKLSTIANTYYPSTQEVGRSRDQDCPQL